MSSISVINDVLSDIHESQIAQRQWYDFSKRAQFAAGRNPNANSVYRQSPITNRALFVSFTGGVIGTLRCDSYDQPLSESEYSECGFIR